MANPFDILRGMLRNENTRGYDNRTVSGGLDKYIPAFEQQARKASFDEALIAEVAAWIRDYGTPTPEKRAEAIKAFAPTLPTSLPKSQPQPARPPQPVQSPVPRPPQ